MASKKEQPAILVDNLHKVFRLPHEKRSSLKSVFVNFFSKQRYEKQKVLRNVSFSVSEGEFFGIVGRNGSGKSTLLKLIAGIYSPTKGTIKLNGKLTPFIELGVGFNPELSGRDNVYLNGALLGFSRKQMDEMYEEIVEFAELERFMDQKLKNYSSGMQVRLAFSIAIRAKSDILLIDEVLAVGDAIFQKKCYDYFQQLKKEKRTVVFVSHDAAALQEYCDRGILVDKGKIIASGNIESVINDYNDLLTHIEEAQIEKEEQHVEGEDDERQHEWGTGEVVVLSAQTQNNEGNKKRIFTDADEFIDIVVSYRATSNTSKPVYGLTIFDASGNRIYVVNTLWSKIKTHDVKTDSKITVKWKVPNVFNTGTYTIAPAVADTSGTVMYNWKDDLAHFKIRKQLQSNGAINVPPDVTIET